MFTFSGGTRGYGERNRPMSGSQVRGRGIRNDAFVNTSTLAWTYTKSVVRREKIIIHDDDNIPPPL